MAKVDQLVLDDLATRATIKILTLVDEDDVSSFGLCICSVTIIVAEGRRYLLCYSATSDVFAKPGIDSLCDHKSSLEL